MKKKVRILIALLVVVVMMFRIPTVPALAYHSEYQGIILDVNKDKYSTGSEKKAVIESVTVKSEAVAGYVEDIVMDLYDSESYEEWGEYYLILGKVSDSYDITKIFYLQVSCESQVYLILMQTQILLNDSTNQYMSNYEYSGKDTGKLGTGIQINSATEFSVRDYSGSVSISEDGGTGSISTSYTTYNSGYGSTAVTWDDETTCPTIYFSGYDYILLSTNMSIYSDLDFCDHAIEDGINTHEANYSGEYSSLKTCYGAYNVYQHKDDLDEFISEYGELLNLMTVYHDGEVLDAGITYDASQIALNNFRCIGHFSNDFDQVYFEFKYDITDYMKENAEQVVFDIYTRYENGACYVFSLWGDSGGLSGEQSISLIDGERNNSSGFNIYLSSLEAVNEFCQIGVAGNIASYVLKGWVVGNEIGVDLSSIPTFGEYADSVVKITNSDIYIEIVPRINHTYGLRYDTHADLLNWEVDYYESTPSESGDYTAGETQKGEENYYVDVSKDDYGNDEYTYYIINENGTTTEINANANVTVEFAEPLTIQFANNLAGGIAGGSSSSSSSSSGGANIDLTIEDDDYSDEQLREDLKDGFGLLDDSGTDAKGDGYVNLVADLIDGADNDLGKIIAFGVSSVVGTAIIRAWLRR